MLYPEGTFVDDVIVHRWRGRVVARHQCGPLAEKDLLVRDKNVYKGFKCGVEICRTKSRRIAIQGTSAVELLQKLNRRGLSAGFIG